MAQAVLPNYQCCFVFDKFETLHPDYTSTRATFRRRATIRDRGLDDPPVLACMTHEAVRPVAGTKGRYGPPLTGTRQLWHFVTLGDRERRLLATTLSVMWRRGGMESQSVTHGAAMASRLQGGQPSWAASSGVGRRKGVQPHSLSSKSGSSDIRRRRQSSTRSTTPSKSSPPCMKPKCGRRRRSSSERVSRPEVNQVVHEPTADGGLPTADGAR